MSVPAPPFVLFAEGRHLPGARRRAAAGRWRFVLHRLDGEELFSAEGAEDAVTAEHLELLAAVRGLEALDQPSRVVLSTSSRYVTRGIRFGLEAWRENGWRWEHSGRRVPITHGDLWRRVDRALEFHQVRCRSWQVGLELVQTSSSARRRVPDAVPLWGLGNHALSRLWRRLRPSSWPRLAGPSLQICPQ